MRNTSNFCGIWPLNEEQDPAIFLTVVCLRAFLDGIVTLGGVGAAGFLTEGVANPKSSLAKEVTRSSGEEAMTSLVLLVCLWLPGFWCQLAFWCQLTFLWHHLGFP